MYYPGTHAYKLRQSKRKQDNFSSTEKAVFASGDVPTSHIMVFLGQPLGLQDSSAPQPAPEPGFLPAMLFSVDAFFSMSRKIRSWISLSQTQFLFTFLTT